ncbi:MAG: preprotein translocase subunit SecG [Muribaculaceae bacterium]
MYALLTILILLASVLLIGVVLIQKSKGGGLASNFASSNQIMGVRKTTDFVEKATWTLAIVVCVLSILTAFVAPRDLVQGGSRVSNAPKQEQKSTPFATQKQAPATPATPAPAEPAK